MSVTHFPSGFTWMNWLLTGSTAVSALLLFLANVKYNRTNIDMEIVVEPPENKGSIQV